MAAAPFNRTRNQLPQHLFEEALNALWRADGTDRVMFIKAAIDMCSFEETNKIMKLLHRKRTRDVEKRKAEEKKKKLAEPLPDWPTFVPQEEPEVHPAAVAEVILGSSRTWFEKYKPTDVVALDCEFAKRHGAKLAELATVFIVSGDKQVLYNGRVKWAPYSYEVNYFTRKCNGLYEHSLAKGESFEVVQAKVKQYIEGKLVIVCGGANDFAALKLEMNNYDVWDLQTYFQEEVNQVDRFGCAVFQPHSLRSIYNYTHPGQTLDKIHSAENDAIGTMKCFMWYRNNAIHPHDRFYMEDFSDMKRIKD